MLSITKLATPQELQDLRKKHQDKPLLLLCWADWDEASTALRAMLEEVPKVYENVVPCFIDCDEADEVLEKLEVETVQTLVIIHPEGRVLDHQKVLGLDPETLTKLVQEQNEFYKNWFNEELMRASRDIESLLAPNDFYIFFKGSKEQPKCKFSRRLVELFKPFDYNYKTYNILEDPRLRYWLKVYSKWQTFPQIYLNKKFVGGIDVVSELVEEGEFDAMVPTSAKALPPIEKFKKTLATNKIVILLDKPQSDLEKGVNDQLLALQAHDPAIFVTVDVDTFKTTFSISELPFIFVEGKPAAGIAGIEALLSTLPTKSPQQSVIEKIESLLKKEVILFMKGTPTNPQCGFSDRIIKILAKYDGLDYAHFNIFEDDALREALKKYSNWPTYPQLYVKGKLVGGIDIVQELDEEGELEDALFPK